MMPKIDEKDGRMLKSRKTNNTKKWKARKVCPVCKKVFYPSYAGTKMCPEHRHNR